MEIQVSNFNPLASSSHFIFSVENPQHQPKVEAPTHEQALEWLLHQGEDATSAFGHYGSPERSIVVNNPKNPEGLKQLAADTGQESIISSKDGKHELHYLNGPKKGQIVHGQGTQVHAEAPLDNYTAVPDEAGDYVYFTHNFDFPPEPEHVKKSESLLKNTTPSVKINPDHGRIIADAYEKMQHNPHHPEVKAAYDALINETKQQYKDLVAQGFKFSKMKPNQPNPYKDSRAVHHDIEHNKHLWYYPTEQGYGPENKDVTDHPLLQPTEFKDADNKPMLSNDLFRQVHDINGHFLGGKSTFGPKGEHQAYLTHKKMYSPLAGKALASETLMQNNWVNFSRSHGEQNRKNPSQTVFAEQKAAVPPDWILNGHWHE